jgi:hypothetical protein
MKKVEIDGIRAGQKEWLSCKPLKCQELAVITKFNHQTRIIRRGSMEQALKFWQNKSNIEAIACFLII